MYSLVDLRLLVAMILASQHPYHEGLLYKVYAYVDAIFENANNCFTISHGECGLIQSFDLHNSFINTFWFAKESERCKDKAPNNLIGMKRAMFYFFQGS